MSICDEQKPNLALYSACIRSNCNAQHGSAAGAAALLKEMGEEGLEPTVEICHDILKVLAVHPDYLLRNAILDYMRQRWFSLRADGHQDVIAGLLRERQYELALDRLDTMVREGIRIEKWLYDMTVYMLCDIEEVDEALRIIKHRTESGEMHISRGVWHCLIDAASSCLHHEATEYVWNRQVRSGYLNPASGICFNVLTTAARHGDAALATDVFRLLSDRKEIFTQQHYEVLIDTYLFVGDIRTALSILCIMHETSTPPDEYSTRRIYKWARVHTGRSQEAFDILKSLKESGQAVPVVAGHALIEATVYRGDLDLAIEQYKALHIICDGGPTTTTFNILLRGCQKRKDLAMFLAAEMVARKIEPDSLTYDRLLLVCLMDEQDYEDAFRYYEEMRNRGWNPRPATFVAMARRCAREQDQRAWEVLEMMKECGVDADGVRQLKSWLDNNWGKVSMNDPRITR
ncbi:uncharacterized protein K452DRAFT_148359 [Aplosporella prunicola CBS 121167]|uniref:Uncharacterized protein n=1 Tax=Aplosporella prunicola CBS 121167 TaxID=1176127 RepID=A0A6A6AZ90_9PEZI|nr:uncharacterized protein K452DRAFT_148359 [Aplosporella prunicola CBS 121167]KAF2136097.1 hypothetical protein K452DRAFT_148359 [Aplosporella prunicola CBS 121167]